MVQEKPSCGNGVCDSSESCFTCPRDCRCAANQECRFSGGVFRCAGRGVNLTLGCSGASCGVQKPRDYSWALIAFVAVALAVAAVLVVLEKFGKIGVKQKPEGDAGGEKDKK